MKLSEGKNLRLQFWQQRIKKTAKTKGLTNKYNCNLSHSILYRTHVNCVSVCIELLLASTKPSVLPVPLSKFRLGHTGNLNLPSPYFTHSALQKHRPSLTFLPLYHSKETIVSYLPRYDDSSLSDILRLFYPTIGQQSHPLSFTDQAKDINNSFYYNPSILNLPKMH